MTTTTAHVLDRLPEYALGTLTRDEHAEIASHVSSCAACAREAAGWSELVTSVAAASVSPIPPRAQIRARVLRAAEGNGRLSRFVDALARFLDVGAEKARALLDVVDDPSSWDPSPVEGVDFMHFEGGLRVAAADCGLVRFPMGIDWPLHRHVGDEGMLILEGGIVDDRGQRFVAGQELWMKPGSQHSFKVLPEVDCLCGVIVFEGLEMPPGTPVRI